ncbi:SGNH/GDSL hydrolase family protein [Flavobacterium sp. BFFFF1]|uniref:SGNH/GDSL hydrolase family protein n=1 Tax=Flavobacterium sp. BFFFF1 TaxID=2015557 RepID=UPI0025C16C4E|nr:SGNH/GDSL hydrolase family protein [Flavobacterium sp. BFFFF1]
MKFNPRMPLMVFFLFVIFQGHAQVAAVQLHGRAERIENETVLIGSASSVSFAFTGDSLSIELESRDSQPHHNYVSLELDGVYLKRLKIEKGAKRWYTIPVTGKSNHRLVIYKATEAANGTVVFTGADTKILGLPSTQSRKKIEFIGNSITCGMGNDTAEIPCGTGEWYDQHNAYWAYGPILSRKLDADFLLSSVSGIGMYRNWNDEHEKEAIMPEVYEKLYLSKDSDKKYDFSFKPDLISICLGTNDLSDGDGKKPRLPFNEEKYVANYIAFVKMIYTHNPQARLVLLTSPMISGEKNATFVKCLERVIAAFAGDKTHKPIALFEFKPMKPNGCGYHPDREDHKVMAAQLESLFKKLLDEK